jgi:hypothetical protein
MISVAASLKQCGLSSTLFAVSWDCDYSITPCRENTTSSAGKPAKTPFSDPYAHSRDIVFLIWSGIDVLYNPVRIFLRAVWSATYSTIDGNIMIVPGRIS